jgi:integrase
MFFAGLRPGEARGVCWEDFDGKRLLVRRSVWHTYTTSPKTEGSAGWYAGQLGRGFGSVLL